MTTQSETNKRVIALPTLPLLTSVLGVSILIGGGWAASAALLFPASGYAPAGLWAGAIVGFCTTASLLAIAPWRPRPVSLCISLWLAQTILRLLITPLLTYLLYSAASLPVTSLALAVGVTYLAAVLSEAVVLARHLKQSRRA